MADMPAPSLELAHRRLDDPGTLADQLVTQTLASLRAASADLALAHDRQRLFTVAKALQRERAHLVRQLAAQFEAPLSGATPPYPPPAPSTSPPATRLQLIDDGQVDLVIDIARTVQRIERKADTAWSTLQRLQPLSDTPARLHPYLFAKALCTATRNLGLETAEHDMLLRISGRALADLLTHLYDQTRDRLQRAGIQPRASTATDTPTPPRPGEIDLPIVSPLQMLQQGGEMHDHHTASAEEVDTLLARLFAHMRVDEGVPPAVRQVIARLQPAVRRLARQDPLLLESARHPVWRLIDLLAACAQAYAQNDPASLSPFATFASSRIEPLLPPPGPTPERIAQTLDALLAFVAQHSQTRLRAQPQALQQLQEIDQRHALRPMLSQQIEQQIGTQRIKSSIRAFLLGPWVDVLTHHMVGAHADEAVAQRMMATVDDLLGSLQRPQNEHERQALKQILPDLVSRIQQGMASILLPQTQQDAILKDLMGIHGHHLLAPAKQKPRRDTVEPSPADLVRKMREEMAEEAAARRQHRQHPANESSSASLPTLPMQYDNEVHDQPHGHTPTEWTQSLRTGMWCRLHLQGVWTTVQLLWISDNRQFFLFACGPANDLQALTRRALERLRAESLAARQEDRSLVQRAIAGLLHERAPLTSV